MSDLISRQDAVNAIDKRRLGREVKNDYEYGLENMLDWAEYMIESLPSVQPEPCEDAVSRQDAIKLACYTSCRLVTTNPKDFVTCLDQGATPCEGIKLLMELPSVQSEIIYCKDCKRHNVNIGDYREENGKRHWYWKDEACPLVGYRGKAEGHEFDYQFCVCAERRQDG